MASWQFWTLAILLLLVHFRMQDTARSLTDLHGLLKEDLDALSGKLDAILNGEHGGIEAD